MWGGGADSMEFNIFSPDDPVDELTLIKDRGDPHSLRSKLWQKEEGTRVS